MPATNGAVLEGKPIVVSMVPKFSKAKSACRGFVAGICRKGDACKYVMAVVLVIPFLSLCGQARGSLRFVTCVIVTIRYLHISGDSSGAPAVPAGVPTVKTAKTPKAPRQPTAAAPALDAATALEIAKLPGSLVCRHFARGHCSIGATCRFAHIRGNGSAAPQAPADGQVAPQALKRKAPEPAVAVAAKRPCQFFLSGLCKRGEKCAYSHDLPTPPAQPAAKKEKKAKAAKPQSIAVSVAKTPVAATSSVSLDRTCIECEEPGIASWQCAKCDDSLYCDSCNALVHKSKVMKSHERVKLAPVPVVEEKKNPVCDECEESESSVMCEQCEVVLCPTCDASVHKFKSLRSHTRSELVKSSGPAPVPAPVPAPKLVVVVQEPVLKKQKVVKAEAVVAPAPTPVVPEISYIESVPKYDLTSESESESSDDEAEPETQEQEDETMDSDNEDEPPIVVNAFPPQSVANAAAVSQKKQVAVAKPVAPVAVVQSGDISSESSDDEDERPVVLAAPVVRKAPVAAAKTAVTTAVNPHEVSSDSETSSDEDDVKPKNAPVVTSVSKPSAANSSSSDEASSSDDEDVVVAKPIVKAPAPAPVAVKRAPASAPKVSYSGSVNPGISTGSSHSLVKRIEAYAESGATEMLHLDANLNGFERLLAHDCAERLGLQHVSVGEGLERHITICRR